MIATAKVLVEQCEIVVSIYFHGFLEEELIHEQKCLIYKAYLYNYLKLKKGNKILSPEKHYLSPSCSIASKTSSDDEEIHKTPFGHSCCV